ncbi:MAG: CHAD domain-containing protein [Hyphomicrobiales bacterium]|nr:CHAD domain-containing protein [Hyphomicrobiales bacterium]
MKRSEARSGSSPSFNSIGRDLPFAAAQGNDSFEEDELKLTGTPASLSAIFKAVGGEPSQSSKVVSTYYDTSDKRLWRRGFSLRIRRKGERYELTLKQQGDDSLRRGEWTTVMHAPVPDIGRLPPQAPRGEIGTILPEELQPRFTTEIDRTQRHLDLPGASVEVSLDVGRIVSDEREAPLVELEFELLDGHLAVMLKHVKSVLGRRRFVVGTRSKADRGMELVDNAPPAPVKAIKPPLSGADTIETAVTKIVAITAKRIIGNVAAAVDGRDPEGVHQLRIGLRRLRSAFGLFNGALSRRAAILGDNAKRACTALGDVRDLDVFLLETIAPVIESRFDGPGPARLASIAEERRQEAYEGTRQLASERWFNSFLLDLLIAGEGGGNGLVIRDRNKLLLPSAVEALRKRHKKVLKVGRGFAGLSSSERHEVRIALKKLRYACDYFQPLFKKSVARPYLKRLASLQLDLGRLNDATVAETLADQLAAGDTDAMIGAALVKGWYRHRLQSVEPHMLDAWRRFTEARPFWRT